MIANNPLKLDGHKLEWHRDRVEAWLSGDRIAPITIDCALTRACNLKCVYCYSQFQNNDEKRLTRDVIFRFLDDAAEMGVKAISLVSDGESTCSPYLYDTISYGKKNGLDMALGTNGILLKTDRMPDIMPALTYLRFNISAADSKRYAEIHQCEENNFEKICTIIDNCVKIKKKYNYNTMIGLQMVLMPEFSDQIVPLAKLGRKLEVDYLVIKHCSDDENGSLGISYDKYFSLVDLLKKAESLSTTDYTVKAKWSKILSGGKRIYTQCYGPPFIMQFSGSGLVAPCGMLFNRKYRRFHIGNIAENSLFDIWKSSRYIQVMKHISSEKYNAKTMCGTLCLQHKVNEYLWNLKNGSTRIQDPQGQEPFGVNFV